MSRAPKIIAAASGALALAGAAACGGYLWRNVTYFRRDMHRVERANFAVHQATVDETILNYAEGPDHGPPLLLIPGQTMDWQNYARVLPELARHFHVFAVDVHGHGGSSRAPHKYTNAAVAQDLAVFIESVIGRPAVVAGHSSGGLIATWLAAHASGRVRAVLLEDPPFLTTHLPRAEQTFNWIDLATNCHTFLAAHAADPGYDDFVAHHLAHAAIWDLFGDGADRFREAAVAERRRHPGEPVLLRLMPPLLNESFRALDSYDPRFGEAFYTASWHDDWDEEASLAAIAVPALYVHTKVLHDDNGVLLGAASNAEAEAAAALIPGGEFVRVDSGHGFHFEQPRAYVRTLREFTARSGITTNSGT